MKVKTAIEKGFTNSGYMFDDIPVFVKFNDDDDESFEAVGINWFYDIYLSLLIWIDLKLNFGKSFEIWLDSEPLKPINTDLS